MLTPEQRAAWDRNGYLVLPGFFSAGELDRVNRLVEDVWRNPPAFLVVDSTVTGKRTPLADVPEAERRNRHFKLNDLYLECPEVRELVLADRLAPVVTELVGDTPVLCNTLNFERGSQQPAHIDSLYMTPHTPGRLAASWIALEDAHPDAGQLFYYPGSHKIPRFRFSDGTHHAISEEMPRWKAHIEQGIEAAGLAKETFSARKGDVLIWHADLVHGGSPIRDPGRTRKSLVSHYLSLADCRTLKLDCVPQGAAYWRRRPHPPLSGQELAPGLRGAVGRVLRKMGVYRYVKRLAG